MHSNEGREQSLSVRGRAGYRYACCPAPPAAAATVPPPPAPRLSRMACADAMYPSSLSNESGDACVPNCACHVSSGESGGVRGMAGLSDSASTSREQRPPPALLTCADLPRRHRRPRGPQRRLKVRPRERRDGGLVHGDEVGRGCDGVAQGAERRLLRHLAGQQQEQQQERWKSVATSPLCLLRPLLLLTWSTSAPLYPSVAATRHAKSASWSEFGWPRTRRCSKGNNKSSSSRRRRRGGHRVAGRGERRGRV